MQWSDVLKAALSLFLVLTGFALAYLFLRMAGVFGRLGISVTRVTDAAVEQAQTVNWQPYSSLAPLPDTRDEVLAIAKALDANLQSDVFLGSEASRDKVIGTDAMHCVVLVVMIRRINASDQPFCISAQHAHARCWRNNLRHCRNPLNSGTSPCGQ